MSEPPASRLATVLEQESRVLVAYLFGSKSKGLDTSEKITPAFKKLTDVAEKHGLKVLLWGSPFGVSETSIVVYDFGGRMESYVSFLQSVGDALPYTDSRTDFVLEW